jgi:hypothetical protein
VKLPAMSGFIRSSFLLTQTRYPSPHHGPHGVGFRTELSPNRLSKAPASIPYCLISRIRECTYGPMTRSTPSSTRLAITLQPSCNIHQLYERYIRSASDFSAASSASLSCFINRVYSTASSSSSVTSGVGVQGRRAVTKRGRSDIGFGRSESDSLIRPDNPPLGVFGVTRVTGAIGRELFTSER